MTCFQVQADPASFSAFGVNALDRATRAASAQACGGPLPSRMMVGLSGPPKIADREAPDALIAEHGFSMLVTVTKAGYQHRVPFDAGTSPIGVRGCAGWTSTPPTLRRIVCSHAHFDHTTALDVLLRVPGPVGLPVLIHPHFWRRRGAVCPGRELPTASPPRF